MDRPVFGEPGKTYGAVHLWMLNDRLEKEELGRQLDQFAALGSHAVIARTFNGLLTPYLSKEFMALMDFIIDKAERLGVQVFLQAGHMPAGVPDQNPDSMLQVIAAEESTKPRGGHDAAQIARDEGEPYYLWRLHHHVNLLNAEAVRGYLTKAYETSWGRLAPELGKRIQSIWVDEPQFHPTGVPWSDSLPQVFRERWGYSIVDHLPSLFHRQGEYKKVRHHYWRTVIDLMLDSYFVQIGNWCAEHRVSFSGHLYGEDSLARQIAWTGSATTPYEYMQLPGVDHLSLSLRDRDFDDLSFVLTPKQCASVANQTGKKEVLAEMFGVSSQGLTFEDQKWIGDFFGVLGINYRCLHGSFYSMQGRRKRIHVPHLSYQQPWWPHVHLVNEYFHRLTYALREGEYVAEVLVLHSLESSFCLYDPTTFTMAGENLADDMVAMDRDLKELGENLLRIHRGFEYGDESIIARHGEVLPGGRLRVGKMAYDVVILPQLLTMRETTLKLLEAFVAAGGTALSTGELPSLVDGEPDPRPRQLGRHVAQVPNTPASLAQVLNAKVPPRIQLDGDDSAHNVWVHERQTAAGRQFFIANTSRTAACRTTFRIPAQGTLEVWDLAGGHVAPLPCTESPDGTETELHFPPAGSKLILFKEGETGANETGADEVGGSTDVGSSAPGKDSGPASLLGPLRGAEVSSDQTLTNQWAVERRDPNAMTLDFCRFRTGDAPLSPPMPVIDVSKRLTDEGYEGPVTLEFAFTVESIPEQISLVVEDAGECRLRLNGIAVASTADGYYVDRSFHPVDITPHVQKGQNRIELTRSFRPLEQSRFSLAQQFQSLPGVELEAVYLTGDFGVQSSVSDRSAQGGCIRLTPEFRLCEEAKVTGGNLIADGYPFFAGRILLKQAVAIERPTPGERLFLSLSQLDTCVAIVRINGSDAGTITWQPYTCEITQWVKEGANEIEIELVNTLRNLLGPHHRPEGEPARCHGEPPFRGRSRAPLNPDSSDDEDGLNQHTATWTDDYSVLPFGLRDVHIVREGKS